MYKKYYNRLLRKILPTYPLKKCDIVIATFPKSGTTWFRFIISNIISLKVLNGLTVDYKLLNGKLRGSFDSFDRPKYKAEQFPDFLATHKMYQKKFFAPNKSIYIVRNPGDTMVSFFEYRKNIIGKNKFTGSFKQFIRDKSFGIEAWCKHVVSWKNKADIIITYEDLKADAFNTIKFTFDKLQIHNISDSVINEAIIRSDFSKVQKMEKEKGKDEKANKYLNKKFLFARKGEVGQWKTYFDEVDLRYMNNNLKKYSINKNNYWNDDQI